MYVPYFGKARIAAVFVALKGLRTDVDEFMLLRIAALPKLLATGKNAEIFRTLWKLELQPSWRQL